jgi:hypothetical protein
MVNVYMICDDYWMVEWRLVGKIDIVELESGWVLSTYFVGWVLLVNVFIGNRMACSHG